MATVLIDTEVYARKLREAGLDMRLAEVMAHATVGEDDAVRRSRAGPLRDDTMWQQSVENRLGVLHNDVAAFRVETNGRFDGVDRKFDAVDRKFESVRARQDWMLGVMAAGFLGLAGLIAHGFHWIG